MCKQNIRNARLKTTENQYGVEINYTNLNTSFFEKVKKTFAALLNYVLHSIYVKLWIYITCSFFVQELGVPIFQKHLISKCHKLFWVNKISATHHELLCWEHRWRWNLSSCRQFWLHCSSLPSDQLEPMPKPPPTCIQWTQRTSSSLTAWAIEKKVNKQNKTKVKSNLFDSRFWFPHGDAAYRFNFF